MDCSEYLEVGMLREERSRVEEANTAETVGSGRLAVYATPAMLALMEKAAADLAEGGLPDDWTTVGVSLNVSHTAATPVGMEVRAAAELTAIEGRKLTFKVTAWDEIGKIGAGVHERVAVSAGDFLRKAESKLAVGKF